MRIRLTITFSALAVLLALPTVLADDVTESATGHRFPATVSVSAAGQTFNLDCVGVGLRKKLMVKVYALGFYLERSCHQILKSQWQPKAVIIDDLLKQPAFSQTLVNTPCARRFELKFVREVDAGKIRESFHEGIAANLPELAKDAALAGAEKQFITSFTAGAKSGDRITLDIFPDGAVIAYLNEKQLCSVRHPRLAAGVAAIWLGGSCISTSLREELVKLFYK